MTHNSTIITQAHALQLALAHPDAAILIVNETERGACKFLAAIKAQISDNELLRALFNDRLPAEPEKSCEKWSETEVTLPRSVGRKEPTFQAIGIGGAITGMHPDCCIVDDMISDEAMENARVGLFTIMEKTNRWVSRLRPIMNKGEPWMGMIFVGTSWWENDSYQFIRQEYGYGERPRTYRLKAAIEGTDVSVQAQRIGDIAIFERPIIEKGTSWFPERWTDEQLAKMRVADSLLFNANMMLNPTAPELVTFKPQWRRYYEWYSPNQVFYRDHGLKDCYALIPDLDCIASVDPAFTERGKEDSRQALVVTGGTPEGLRLILLASATRQSMDGFLTDIVDALKRYAPRKLLIEKAGQQLTFINEVRRRLNAANLRTVVTEVSPAGHNKDLRIAALEPFFERGLIVGERNQHDFWTEYASFPRGKLKDLLDALAYQPPFWHLAPDAGTFVPGREQERVRQELANLYARMGVQPLEAPQPDRWRRADGSRR